MAAKAEAAPGDPLKYYCIVFAVLIAVIGFVWFRIRGQLEEYRAENAYAEKLLTNDENATDSQGRPRQLAALGLRRVARRRGDRVIGPRGVDRAAIPRLGSLRSDPP